MLPKKRNLLIATFVLLGFKNQAQLTIQSGATFTVQPGALVTVQGNVDNAGSLSNDGTLKVQGNYLNTGSYTGSTIIGALEFYGNGNSDVHSGASSIANLFINKTDPASIVKLLAPATVTYSFTLTNGIFTTDPIANPSFNLSSPVTATYNFAAGKEIVGSVKRTGFTGSAPHMFNQPNMLVTANGGTAPTDFTVTMIPESAGGDPTQAEREVKRKYTFAQTGGSGFTADIRYPYVSTELNTNTEANLVPWTLVAAEWNARLTPVTRDTDNDYVTTTGIPAADLAQEWKLADPNYTMNVTANLSGPWNGVSAMNTTLNTAGIIPLSQPYSDPAFNYTGTESVVSVPPNAVDWVLIEHRKPASGLPENALISTITGSQAGFLLNNGTVINKDGGPLVIPITKQGIAFITIRHRNHLGVLSNSIPSNAAGTFTNDFTVLGNSYKPSSALSNPVVLLAGNEGKYGLWAGDANKNGVVSGGDINTIKVAIANLASGYHFSDVTLNGAINGGDVGVAKTTIALLGTGSGTNSFTGNNQNKKIKTNLPDTITED